MLRGLADCVGNLISFQNQRLLQDHLNGRAYIEKEIASVNKQRDRGHAADCTSDHGADYSILRRAGRSGEAG